MEKRWEAKNDDASNHEREVSTKGTSGKVLKTTLAYLIGGIYSCLSLFLFVIVLSVQSGSSSPVPTLPEAHLIEKRSARRYYGGRNRYSSGSRVNQGLKK